MDDDVYKSNHEKEATKDPVQQTRYVADEVECLVENTGDVNGGSKEACVEEPLPVSVMENRVDEIAPLAGEQFQDAAVGGASDKSTTEKAALESEQGCSDASGISSKQGISKLLSHYGTKIMKEKPLSTSMEDQASAKVDKKCRAAQGKVNVESNACEPAVIEDKDALVGVLGDFTDGIEPDHYTFAVGRRRTLHLCSRTGNVMLLLLLVCWFMHSCRCGNIKDPEEGKRSVSYLVGTYDKYKDVNQAEIVF